MTTTVSFKDGIDQPLWRPESPPLGAPAAGTSVAWDMTNDASRNPLIWMVRGAGTFESFDPVAGDWMPLSSPVLGGTFGAGATLLMHPSQGPRGTIAAGASTSSITLTTALPAAVGTNQLANRGDGVGYKIRIIGNAAGSSGKTEERTIIANSSGTTPTLYLDAPLSFTPASGDAYELRSGRIYFLSAGVLASSAWKYYDIATNFHSATMATTNLPATIGTDSSAIALSENYVPYNRNPSEGFVSGGGTTSDSKNAIVATASSSTTITGSGMFADLQANEYRNFQVRIVEDTTTPTAVGQRRRITSHTSGATGVFTVPTWTVTPSSTAKFVIENDDDKILLRSSATTTVYTYNITGNTWDTTTFGASSGASGAGCVFAQSFGVIRDIGTGARHSNIFFIRGGGVASIDVLDIAGSSTGTWTAAITYGKSAQTFTTGTSGAYDPWSKQGRYLYINVNGTQRFARFDMKNRTMDASTYMRFSQGAAAVGQKMAGSLFIDGATKISMIYNVNNAQAYMHSMLIQ